MPHFVTSGLIGYPPNSELVSIDCGTCSVRDISSCSIASSISSCIGCDLSSEKVLVAGGEVTLPVCIGSHSIELTSYLDSKLGLV